MELCQYAQSMLEKWRVFSISFTVENLYKSCKIILYGKSVSSPFIYSIIYRYYCGLKGIYFIPWLVIQYYFMDFVVKIILVLSIGNSFSWLLAPFDIPPSKWNFCCCSVAKLCLAVFNPKDCSTPGFPVLPYHLEFSQTHVHWVGNAIQPSHPLLSPSPPAINLSQHQCLFQWFGSLHQVAKILEFQHKSF